MDPRLGTRIAFRPGRDHQAPGEEKSMSPTFERPSSHRSQRVRLRSLVALAAALVAAAPSAHAADAPAGFDDHQNMMEQLGIKALRRGANPNDQSTFAEATANPYKDSLPDVLRMKDGTRVTRASQWPKRRAEIVEDFEREVYGRIPDNVPAVKWEVTATTRGDANGIPTVTRTLVGHVDNSAYPALTVEIQASYTVPASRLGPVPIMVEFSFGFGRPGFTPAWHNLAIARGW